ncbi:hypothetical protein [Arcicella rosea]|uniref:Uncharacterized protein n=1 Tax=Arcicella rosea TaxID=502909 RepID=A0A841ENC8_9BACT|nr:hypothetical protein [Arcicella rosea]MBB6002238.1 hypothetical protein [Arcicella rosea]
MKNTFQFLIFLSLFISCEQNKEIKPLNNKIGIDAVNYFKVIFTNIESVDTLSIIIKDKKEIKSSNVLPRFQEHFMYVDGEEYDLNHYNQSSVSVHQNKVTVFKLFLNK